MTVEQELATTRAETRYLCCRWEENRRIKTAFMLAVFGLDATGPKGHRGGVRFSNASTGMDVSQPLLLLCANHDKYKVYNLDATLYLSTAPVSARRF